MWLLKRLEVQKKIMSSDNRLARLVKKIQGYPAFLRKPLLNFALRKTVKLVGTAKVEVLELNKQRSEFRLKNRKKVQNHIGTIHAAGMALIAETATGMVVGMNVPDDKVPVIKTLKVDFLKRAKGDLVAKAHLTEEQIQDILTLEKGEVEVAVTVTDSEGKEPIGCKMLWAWTPRRN
jgi:acyl-coenzyme A thioesterase PaaI-like protein